MKKILFSLLGIFILISCEKKDILAPVISSINLETGDTLRNNFVIKVLATDNTNVVKMDIYANDSLISGITKLPLEYDWNTSKMKDGEYTIKAVVFDAKGNNSDYKCKVVIQNALLAINLGSQNHNSYKFVVSDEDGNILNSATIEGSGVIRIMPNSAYDKPGINFAYRTSYLDFTGLTAFVHIKRGSTLNMNWSNMAAPVLNGVRFHLKNDIGTFTKICISADNSYYILTSMADTALLPQSIGYSAGHKILVQLETDAGKFYSFVTVDNIPEITVNLSSVKAQQASKSISFPDGGSEEVLIQGLANEKDSINRYYLSQMHNEYNGNHIISSYPPEYFAQYLTNILYTPQHSDNNYKSYINRYRGVIPDNFTPLSADIVIVNPDPGNFKANISGNFDSYSVSYYNTSLTINLQVAVPMNQNAWKLPDLAAAFNNEAYRFDNFVWNQVQVSNYKSLDWSTKYYDIGLNFEKINWFEEFSQTMWIHNAQSPYKGKSDFVKAPLMIIK